MSQLLSRNGFTRRLHELVSEHPDFEVLSEPAAQFYCFRYVPNALAERQHAPDVQAQLDRLNQEIAEAVQRDDFTQVVTIEREARIAIHVRHRSDKTSRDDVDAVFEFIARWGRLLSKGSSLPKMEVRQCLSESHSSSTEVSAM